jgi:SAM-dependent methyltransferase
MNTSETLGGENGRHDGPTTMGTNEDTWWERERAIFVRSRLAALSQEGDVVVDVGCGRATMLDDAALAGRICVNVDSYMWDQWRGQDRLFVVASAEALPFRSGAARIAGSFDVLEHIADDQPALAEQSRIISADGHVVAAVPADPRLWSAFDDSVGHFRRYTPGAVGQLGSSVGLAVRASTHFFSYLWPFAWLTRKSSMRVQAAGKSTGPLGRAGEFGVRLFARAERFVLTRRALPVGTSLWIEWTRTPDPM